MFTKKHFQDIALIIGDALGRYKHIMGENISEALIAEFTFRFSHYLKKQNSDFDYCKFHEAVLKAYKLWSSVKGIDHEQTSSNT